MLLAHVWLTVMMCVVAQALLSRVIGALLYKVPVVTSGIIELYCPHGYQGIPENVAIRHATLPTSPRMGALCPLYCC